MTLLNVADSVYAGASPVLKIYAGASLVWEPGGTTQPPTSGPPEVISIFTDEQRGATATGTITAQDNDWLVAIAMDDYTSGTELAFGGTGGGTWQDIGSPVGDDTAGEHASVRAAYKVCAAGDYTVTASTVNGGILFVALVSGATAISGTPADLAQAQTVSGGAKTLGPVTTDVADALLFGAWKGQQFSTTDPATDWSQPAGMTMVNLDDPSGNGNGAVAYETLTATGSYSRSSTLDVAPANGFAGKLFAIAGGASGGTQAPSGGGTEPTADQVTEEKAYQITSTAENSTVNWWDNYDYIEDIKDGRGYTGGIVGFTSATGDMLDLVQNYSTLAPGNILEQYIDNLQNTTAYGDTVDYVAANDSYGTDGGGASTEAANELGPPYLADWATAATNDALFRQAQRDYRESVYWNPAYAAAQEDGVGPLGLALYYDTSINHGPGDPNSGDGSFDDIRSQMTRTTPANGGDEILWLQQWINKRSAVLTAWGDNPADGRISMWQGLLDTGNLTLTTPFSWSVYGDNFTMSTDPTPNTT